MAIVNESDIAYKEPIYNSRGRLISHRSISKDETMKCFKRYYINNENVLDISIKYNVNPEKFEKHLNDIKAFYLELDSLFKKNDPTIDIMKIVLDNINI